jgi:hypothetical protein
VVDRAEQHHYGRHAHDHVEVADHEVGVRERQVDRHVAEEQAREAAVHEREGEADGEQVRNVDLNVAAPQREHSCRP